ncbi:hypothetical protein GQ55_4G096200 [Panicum hallii var. hallii]|uniref:Glycosyltransferase n=1 Tax=Panicum hallii var. hallii TaxID=1504633 RepID=A0A2T7DWY8_9POAL|nr:hypothetical protein GQ55_4G096200 [Panicum hallii var. hallii]PUZ60094.1 hypothetical protein GQ55_4G096200 [Panicum hallii var. hallii]PUZ60095.1 hypothetical protein GQ55_4G096200 [Panicum hallii var. hallii]
MEEMSPRPHFLVLTFPFQGHIAPALRLARRLLAAAPDALVTFSTTEAAHARMFPATPEADGAGVLPDGDEDGRLEFLPFPDGTEAGYVRSADPGAFNAYMASFHAAGARGVAGIVDALAARGRPVTRVVYTLLLPWAAGVARDRGVPSALYWIQPAAVFAIYHHYFHGHAAGVVAEHRRDPSFVVELPGLAPQAIGDLPSFLTDSTDPSDIFHSIFNTIRDLIETLDKESPRATVLVNTCQELEPGSLAAVGAHDVLPVGPVLPSGDESGIFKQDGAEYMEWLDAKPANSVVYVSFGSLASMAREQLDELLLGLEVSGRPYLCVIRKDVMTALAEAEAEVRGRLRSGVAVEWCDQVRVLSHAAVGCFVTHCGWNSVLESVASGVPMVCVPRMSDQRMNAQLVVREWRVGVRAQVDSGGVLRAAEVGRCVDEVMGDSEAAAEARRMAGKWKRMVAEATGKGGSSERNLMAFVDSARSTV